MKELNIGRILMENRQRKGITQEELAEYVGVSKASVSKWETGTTYPDITLLPRLATFFHITIDELMGYAPQMEQEDIRRLYRRLCAEFADGPFETAVEHCREIVRKYFSCPPLLFQVGALYLNHCMLAETQEKTVEILEEALKLFQRVKEEGEDVELVRQSVHMEAFCLLALGRADEARELLEPLKLPMTAPEALLARALQMNGKTEEAKQTLQAGIYRAVCELMNFLPNYMMLCLDDRTAFEESYLRCAGISEIFRLESLHPSLMLTFYITAAQGFVSLGREEESLELLERYASLACRDIWPLRLHGDPYFHLLDQWLETALPLGHDLPRNEAVVRKSITEGVADNPAFSPLSENFRFRNIIRRLKKNEKGGLNQDGKSY